MLPPKIPRKPKRASRWRSQAHCNHVRGFACANCWSTAGIEVAHLRNGSGAGIGQKPDDWNTIPLCGDCHREQHTVGEKTFWKGKDPRATIEALIKCSPKRHEIEQVRRDRDS